MYEAETRRVSDAVWWNPLTWSNFHIEVRRVWDMDFPMSKAELPMFMNDNACKYGVWQKVGYSYD